MQTILGKAVCYEVAINILVSASFYVMFLNRRCCVEYQLRNNNVV